MKASVNWIKELLPSLKATPAAIAKRLTHAGIEVEGIDAEADKLANVVVAEVRELKPHPDADTLRIARVFDGESELDVVCGAPNVAVGQKVAFARLGATLPNGVRIETRKIRGFESSGMICSEVELGIGEDASGILVLRSRARPGKPIAGALQIDDVVLEVSPTPNRPDALSHLGLARELAALFGLSLPKVSVRLREKREPAPARAKIEIADGARCPKYVARVISGVKIGPSPAHVVRRLKAVGLRSISNVVDATNLALVELGHPLHAFDLDRLKGGRIVVRLAGEGEKLTTLDGVARTLTGDDLVIADAEVPVALAGVIGGADTEVTEQTVNVLLESALFEPRTVRRTSRRHALHTEASHRFERGADPGALEIAIDRAAELIVDLAGGEIAKGRISVDLGAPKPRVVSVRPERAALVLGRPVERKEAKKTLGGLGLRPASRAARKANKRHKNALFFEVPSWRVDLSREEDLIEEIARLAGYDSIPTTMPPTSAGVISAPSPPDPERKLRAMLAGQGFLETISLAFNSRQQLEPLGFDVGQAVEVANPLGEESALMRMSLLPALLRAARHNQDVLPSIVDLRLFELGKTFAWSNPPGRLPVETLRAGILMRGHRVPVRWAWKDAKGSIPMLDAYDLKGVVELVLASFRVSEVTWFPHEARWLHPRSATRIERVGRTLGVFGELHPDVMGPYGLEGPPLFFADLLLDPIQEASGPDPAARALPKNPPAHRDLSFFIGREVTSDRVLSVVRGARGAANLEAVEVFDVYEGAGLPEGKRSLAIAMTFRAADRTLTDAEVQSAQQAIIQALASEVGAEIRTA